VSLLLPWKNRVKIDEAIKASQKAGGDPVLIQREHAQRKIIQQKVRQKAFARRNGLNNLMIMGGLALIGITAYLIGQVRTRKT